MDWGALTPLVLEVASLILVLGIFLQRKREGTLHLLTLSHLPPKIRRLVWYGIFPGILLVTLFLVMFGI